MTRLPEDSSEVVPAATAGRPPQSRSTQLAQPGVQPEREPERIVTGQRQEMRAAVLAGGRWRRTARWLGLIIFIIGAGLLTYVFWQALLGFQRFSQPGYLNSQLNTAMLTTGDGAGAQIQAVIVTFGSEFLRVLYLILLGFLASVIAAKGIQFFSASEAVIDEAIVPSGE